jgi:uncharacterized Zn finger protein (UPF0148 family)
VRIVRATIRYSEQGSLVCPRCEKGELVQQAEGHPSYSPLGCPVCGYAPNRRVLGELAEIIALPVALGKHACGCGHPEMRLLPDGMFRCPACGDEVLPVEETSATAHRPEKKSKAYLMGWGRYRFGKQKKGSLGRNEALREWEGPYERLEYYRGRRAGRQECRLALEAVTGPDGSP